MTLSDAITNSAIGPSGVQWSTEQVSFLAWLALPRRLREPTTRLLLSKELGVHVTTLQRWQSLPGWKEALSSEVRRSAFQSAEMQADVIAALIKQANKGSYYHIRLYLEIAGIYNPKAAVESSVTVILGVNPEDV